MLFESTRAALRDGAVDKAARHLDSMASLSYAIFDHIKLDEHEFDTLTRVLLGNNTPNVVSLSFEHAGITGEHAAALIGALTQSHNTAIRWVRLCNNQLGDTDIEAIAGALERNDTLHSLLLGNNRIGDAGAEALSRALVKNQSCALRELYIWDNQITESGARALVSAAQVEHSRIEEIGLSGNPMSWEEKRDIDEAVESCKKVRGQLLRKVFIDLFTKLVP